MDIYKMNPALDRWTTEDDKSLTEILGLDDVNTSPVGETRPADEVNLRILGVEPEFPDDLSTIANDTYTAPVPNGRKLMTPLKIKYGHDDDDEDGDTLPETPPKSNRSGFSFHSDDSKRRKQRFSTILCLAFLLGLVLLGAIGAMSYLLHRIRTEDAPRAISPETPLDEPLDVETPRAPPLVEVVDTLAPTDADTATQVNSEVSTEEPTPMDSDATTLPPLQENQDWLLQALLSSEQAQFFNVATLLDEQTIQNQVFTWLAEDPALQTYDVERLVQRYALGTVYQSLRNAPLADVVEGEWMDYNTDECDWPLTRPDQSLCGDTVAQFLYLETFGLNGTLATEIGLLTDLKMIFLTANQIQGPIPTQIGRLTLLERFSMPRNQLEGSLPTQLGLLDQLGMLNLGNNNLVGEVPTQLGDLQRLGTLRLQNNQLTGTIPDEIGLLPRLSLLALDANNFTGPVPSTFANLTTLESLALNGNDITGVLPESLCGKEIWEARVDCEQVTCACCEGCVPPENFVPFPLDPEVTEAPTEEEDEEDTLAPTECALMETAQRCFDVGQTVEFALSNCDPDPEDLLALVALDDFEENGLRDPLIWTRVCDAADCSYQVEDQRLTEARGASEDLPLAAWPYPPGAYRLLFLRSIRPGAALPLAEMTFFISEDCLAV